MAPRKQVSRPTRVGTGVREDRLTGAGFASNPASSLASAAQGALSSRICARRNRICTPTRYAMASPIDATPIATTASLGSAGAAAQTVIVEAPC